MSANVSFRNSVLNVIILLSISSLGYLDENNNGFCPEYGVQIFNTKCISCSANENVQCPNGTEKINTTKDDADCYIYRAGRYSHFYPHHFGPGVSEMYRRPIKGCQHTCQRNVTINTCCKGYWGENCAACPGGAQQQCHGHGICDDHINGTGVCTCDEGWTGYACEFCLNDTLSNCTLAPEIRLCQNVTCLNNSHCTVIDHEQLCVCNWPFVKHEDKSSDTTNMTEIMCTEVDFCIVPPLCHANATCIRSNDHGKNCTCNFGFHGDGYECDAVNPCQVNNGGCDLNTTGCIFKGPGKRECTCLDGYHGYVPDQGCSLIDMCAYNASVCHPNATCQTEGPNGIKCTCMAGYEGDGFNCYGNILQTIVDLDETDTEFKGKLKLTKGALMKYFMTEITEHGPFTIFVPTAEGFKSIADYNKWLDDDIRVQQIIRQHIVVGEFTMDKLVNQSVFYTLQGSAAELQVSNRGDIFKFRILDSSRRAKIDRGDILASNGIIHIINTLMVYKPEYLGNNTISVYSNIQTGSRYEQFKSLIEAADSDVETLMRSKNVTVFVPTKSALFNLPTGALDFLQSDQGKIHLTAILMNHVVKRPIEISELINFSLVMTAANTTIEVNVTETGQVQLNKNVSITQADIVASNGFIHEINAVLIPESVILLPNRCDQQVYSNVTGPCGDCRKEGKCYYPDVELNVTVECEYKIKNLLGKDETVKGCAPKCRRTNTMSKCCDGFYGYDCQSCPGGYKNPCNGNGKCDEGITGHGYCTCNENFSGLTCNRCKNSKRFGSNCTQECTCLNGICNNNPEGNGLCKYGFCLFGYSGDNCEKSNFPCSNVQKYCHAHAECMHNEAGGQHQLYCLCQAGYMGDGENCVEIDPCKTVSRGNCHQQATCVMVAPGVANCTCNEGWIGDGIDCSVESMCKNHSDCHKFAMCFQALPGKYTCVCMEGFEGNGTHCVYKNRCEVNNGGCHHLAICSHDERSIAHVNCTCPVNEGYSGNGFSCYGNILKQIEDHPKLSIAKRLLKQMDSRDRHLLTINEYTVFVPTDPAIKEFLNKSSFSHWQKYDNFMTLLNYHTVAGRWSLDQLVAYSEIKKQETMTDGFSIFVQRDDKGVVTVSSRKSGSVTGTVVEGDIVALNGYIHLIDTVIEPYEPLSQDNYTDLKTFFQEHQEYSIFSEWLKNAGLIETLENSADEFTLFAPTNDAVMFVNRTVTLQYLQYYILPKMLMTVAVSDGERVATSLGTDHQLVFHVNDLGKVTVNGVPIIDPDMFTFGGIVNGISGLLHPVQHQCDELGEIVTLGICAKCNGSLYQCGVNETAQPGKKPLECKYSAKRYFSVEFMQGCQGFCVKMANTSGCCAGYYGAKCDECPGGPEFPCSSHGTCNDGISGNGKCKCYDRFFGKKCDMCIPGWAGSNCDIDMNSCAYQNGGCHSNANCTKNEAGKIICQCEPGFQGDGFNCTGPCEINNGGCHVNSSCTFMQHGGVSCECNEGLVGDGRSYCNADLYTTLLSLNKASWFFKTLSTIKDDIVLSDLKSSNSTMKYTVFVPIADRKLNMVLPEWSIYQQIVMQSDIIYLHGIDFHNQTVHTLSKDSLEILYSPKEQMFYVNNIKVLQGNIVCTNGIIHLVAAPFMPLTSDNEIVSTKSWPLAAVIGPVIAVVIIAIIVIIAYRKSHERYWKVLHEWISRQMAYHGNNEQAEQLCFKDEDASSRSSLANTDFGNPLFKEDLE